MNSEASIWDDADFEPFFISFSGGGASYTSTVTKQSIKEQTRTRTLSSNSGGSLGIEASLNDIGFETSFGDMSTLTETRSQSQNSATSLTYSYTLSDEEETNMFLVAVIPGRGLNGPIFLNLGAITSCPYVAEDEAEFHEWYPALIPGLSNINPTMLDCESGTVQTPTWANTIDPNALVLEQSTGQVWTHMNPAPNFSYDGLGSDAVALQATVAMSAAMAATAGLAASGGNVGGAVLAGVVVGAGLGMFAADLVKTTIWRNAVAAEYGTTFESTGYNTASLVAIEQATNQTEIFLAPGMCADIFDPEKTWMVQPSTVPTQVPELSVSYTNPVSGEVISEAQSIVGEDGELSPALSATAFMDEPIGMTLHLRHNPSNPIGWPPGTMSMQMYCPINWAHWSRWEVLNKRRQNWSSTRVGHHKPHWAALMMSPWCCSTLASMNRSSILVR